MFTIKSQTGYVEISDISISMVYKSSIFDESDGGYTYNFTIPVSDSTSKLLGFPERVHAPLKEYTVEVEAGFDNIFFIKSNLLVVEASEDVYECSMGLGKGDFYSLVQNMQLSDLDLGGERSLNNMGSSTPASFCYFVGKGYPNSDFAAFTVQNDAMCYVWSEYPDPLIDIPFLNIFNVDRATNTINYGLALTPFPYVVYVVKQIFETNGFNIVENILFDDAQRRKVCIINPIMMDNGAGLCDLSEHLPDMSVIDFLSSICKFLCVKIFINHYTKEARIISFGDFIGSKATIDYSQNCVSTPVVNPEKLYNGARIKFKKDENDAFWMSRVVDDLDVLNALPSVLAYSDLAGTGNYGDICLVRDVDLYYKKARNDSGTAVWEFFSENIFSKYEEGDLTNEDKIYAVEFEATPVCQTNSYLEKIFIEDPSVPIFDFAEVISEVPEYPDIGGLVNYNGTFYTAYLDTDFSSTPIPAGNYVQITDYVHIGGMGTVYVLVRLAHRVNIPVINTRGNERRVTRDNGFEGFGLRLAFDHGMIPMANFPEIGDNCDYPYGSSLIKDFAGNSIADATFNLFIDKDQVGIVNTFYKSFLYYIQYIAKSATFQRDFDILELKELDLSSKIRAFACNFLIDQIRITISNNEIKTGNIEAFVCP